MANFEFHDLKVAGIASVVPKNLVDMRDLAEVYGEDAVKKTIAGTGIKMAHRAAPEQTASDLGYAAAKRLLDDKNILPESIGIFVFVTQSPDYRRPSSASILHGKLGLPLGCAAMEVNLGCSGFMYGLETVAAMMNSSREKYALLVLGETASKLTNIKDRSTNMLYGDGACALLLERSEGAAPIWIKLMSDGSRHRAIILPAGGFRDMNASRDEFVCSDGNTRSLYDIHMDGTAVFSFTITDVPASINSFMEDFHTNIQDYDYVFLHQANEFIIKQFIRKFKLKKESVPVSLDRYGNTGGVSIPLTICDRLGDADEGTKRIFASGFGIGLSWGIAVFEVDTANVLPIEETDYFDEKGKLKPEEL